MANSKAGPKELDLAFMTEEEVTEAFKNASLNHMRVIVSNEMQKWCDSRVPKLSDTFCQRHYNNMREFCKETVDDEYEPDFQQLLLDGFQMFFGSYHELTRRCVDEANEDISDLGMRLVMNYYMRRIDRNLRSLTLVVDFLPQSIVESERLYTAFQQTRCTHEFELNLLH